MEEEEAKKVYEEVAGKLRLSFSSYYKYTFSFVGEVDGVRVNVSYGESADDIYRYEVSNTPIKAPLTFADLLRMYYCVSIEKSGKMFNRYF